MLVIAHRGASAELLENTLPAFERAVQLGADFVELDVHANAAGQLVVTHDPPSTGRQYPTLEEALDLMRGRTGVMVELKTPRRYRRHDVVARTVRLRQTLRLKVRALTAEGRLSGIFLSVTPFLLIGIISLLSPDYFRSVLDNPLIMPEAIIGLLMLLAGWSLAELFWFRPLTALWRVWATVLALFGRRPGWGSIPRGAAFQEQPEIEIAPAPLPR